MSRSSAATVPAAEVDPRWPSVVARDPAADGAFWYSVRTTGVYCRPSCGARTPRPENVAFHPSPADAARAGFRPCKRCRPDGPPPGATRPLGYGIGACALGALLVARSDRGVRAILLGEGREAMLAELQERFPRAPLTEDPSLAPLIAKVARFVEAPGGRLDVALDAQGTAFQQRVWGALREVPVGETVSYAEVAERIGAPRSTRAVAQACGANVLAVAIPCHRVVRGDGALSGYRWGVARKRALLDREATS